MLALINIPCKVAKSSNCLFLVASTINDVLNDYENFTYRIHKSRKFHASIIFLKRIWFFGRSYLAGVAELVIYGRLAKPTFKIEEMIHVFDINLD